MVDRRRILAAARYGAVVGIFAWLLLRADLASVFAKVMGVAGWRILLGFSLVSLQGFVGAFRWRTVLLACGGREIPSILRLLRLVYAGFFYNAFFPVAGDVARGAATRSCFENPAAAWVVVALERIAGLAALAAVALPALAVQTVGIQTTAGPWLAAGLLCAVAGFWFITRPTVASVVWPGRFRGEPCGQPRRSVSPRRISPSRLQG